MRIWFLNTVWTQIIHRTFSYISNDDIPRASHYPDAVSHVNILEFFSFLMVSAYVAYDIYDVNMHMNCH